MQPDYVKIATGLFIMLNPLVLVPVFLALTSDMPRPRQMRIALTTSLSVFLIMTIVIFTGHRLLVFFGITVNDFRLAGGVLIFLMAISMARASDEGMRYSDKEHAQAKQSAPNIAVVPLAIPLMAGPASISVAIIDAGVCSSLASRAILTGIVAGLCLVLWVAMALAEEIGRRLGTTGRQILTRVMGLILLAIAIDFLVVGIRHAFLGPA